MRFISAIILSTLALGVLSRRSSPAPKIVSIQINRCPTPAIYKNADEEENVSQSLSSETKLVVQSEFDETLRFEANETGTIQFFVVGRGNFSVNVQTLPSVFADLHGTYNVTDRGAVISIPFKVLQGVRETPIKVTLTTKRIEKTTLIYASTKDLEPPRPPSLHTSIIFTPEEMEQVRNETQTTRESTGTDTVTPPPSDTKVIESEGASGNVTNSQVTIKDVEFPSVDDVLTGDNSSLSSNTLRLDSITLNRVTANKTDRFVSETNVYFVTIKKFERGQIMFYVSGNGQKQVTVKSITEKKLPAKVMKVADDYAAFSYTDGVGYVEQDEILVKVDNDLGEVLYFYLTMTRVD
ncbi:hypothetical protein GCK72_023270 [Caenorhabditis remanei]|uniref:AMIN domain-containing protein n=1 Tax=Caenorhabditis remanei TaxID=31234 RepID=A0A6A5FWB9_CAERE|nr:hypothetical protein GCK72_023270 [Caenorhabditis remanei]KAF1746812.1 hypothetical protein GCK72_023270 [Caenorhabditis remanei]